MTIRVHSASIAMFLVGMIALLAGAFAIGLASSEAAQGATQPYQTVRLGYLALARGEKTPCGESTSSLKGNYVRAVTWDTGDKAVICEAVLKVLK